jgi:hypothetical protein
MAVPEDLQLLFMLALPVILFFSGRCLHAQENARQADYIKTTGKIVARRTMPRTRKSPPSPVKVAYQVDGKEYEAWCRGWSAGYFCAPRQTQAELYYLKNAPERMYLINPETNKTDARSTADALMGVACLLFIIELIFGVTIWMAWLAARTRR